MKKVFDFTPFQDEIFPQWSARFRSGEAVGEYSYTKRGPTSLYGTTDILFCRYIMGESDFSEREKDQWAATINRFQRSGSGWYRRRYFFTHYKEHSAAYAVAALHLLGRKPRYRIAFLDTIQQSYRNFLKWIESNWITWTIIWPGTQKITGPPAMIAMLGLEQDTFFDWYFEWLDKNADPGSGFWCRGLTHRWGLVPNPTIHEMGGAFHMFFIYEWFKRKWRYQEKVIDQTLGMQKGNGKWDGIMKITYCIDLDAVYNMLRSSRNIDGYRRDDIRDSCARYLSRAEKLLNDRDFVFSYYRTTHRIVGALSAVAECQTFYPELVKTSKPWVQTLDRACFI